MVPADDPRHAGPRTVADRRLNYAVEAQELFNNALARLAPGKVTAVSGPYRALECYPPTSFRNVDEVDLMKW